jgi:hypothetical protein
MHHKQEVLLKQTQTDFVVIGKSKSTPYIAPRKKACSSQIDVQKDINEPFEEHDTATLSQFRSQGVNHNRFIILNDILSPDYMSGGNFTAGFYIKQKLWTCLTTTSPLPPSRESNNTDLGFKPVVGHFFVPYRFPPHVPGSRKY